MTRAAAVVDDAATFPSRKDDPRYQRRDSFRKDEKKTVRKVRINMNLADFQDAVEEGGIAEVPEFIRLQLLDRVKFLAGEVDLEKTYKDQSEAAKARLKQMSQPDAVKNLIVTMCDISRGMLVKAFADGYCAGLRGRK